MVTGALGVLGEVAPNHVDLEQEQDLGAATILQQGMGGDTAVDQAACQKLATQELVIMVMIYTTDSFNCSVL